MSLGSVYKADRRSQRAGRGPLNRENWFGFQMHIIASLQTQLRLIRAIILKAWFRAQHLRPLYLQLFTLTSLPVSSK
jgi:hypothetical protein